jgi:retron-type reverse transcriptase
MIVYNVTCHLSESLLAEWLQWMKTVHIPEVMQTGCFSEFKIFKLLNQAEDDEGVNIAIQYKANTLSDYERYKSEFAPALQLKTREKYGEQILAYRSLLEEIG